MHVCVKKVFIVDKPGTIEHSPSEVVRGEPLSPALDLDLTVREKTFLEGRWKLQQDYFSKNAAFNKSRYRTIQFFIGIAGTLVPVLINIPDVSKLFPTILSAMVTVAMVLEGVNHYGQNWRNSRLASEALKAEKSLYENHAGRYRKTENPFEMFVERCENIMGDDVRNFETILEEVGQTTSSKNNALTEMSKWSLP